MRSSSPLLLSLSLVSSSSLANVPLTVRIQHAANLSERGGNNITAAFAAVEQWCDIVLVANQQQRLPRRVAYLVHRLYASSLVRIGRDAAAIDQYERALQEIPEASCRGMEWNSTQFEQGRCWQRLMNYQKAHEVYLDVGKGLEAAICAMRLGDMDVAMRALGTVETEVGHTMLALLRALMGKTHMQSSVLQQQIDNGSSSRELIGNNGAFDDPLLVHLDDKVFLHTLLSSSDATRAFWPEGELVSREDLSAAVTTNTSSPLWIAKSRSGYGSHGNRLLRLEHCSTFDVQRQATSDDTLLLQRVIHPPCLLNGRKFSLRVYVVRIGATSHFSKDAIVKVAKDAWTPEGTVVDQHMTNSGRGEAMTQAGFGALSDVFSQEEDVEFWNNLRNSLRLVLSLYDEAASRNQLKIPGSTVDKKKLSDMRARIASMGLPKILGFDYVVDANRRPWLIEVNRFPGLEPRDDVDTPIKQAIVADAWTIARGNGTPLGRLELL